MVDIVDWGSVVEESLTARTFEWAAETALNLSALSPQNGATSGLDSYRQDSIVTGCSSRSSSSSSSHREHRPADSRVPLVDLEGLLQALAVENATQEHAAFNSYEAGTTGPSAPVVRTEIRPIGPLPDDARSALLATPVYEYTNNQATMQLNLSARANLGASASLTLGGLLSARSFIVEGSAVGSTLPTARTDTGLLTSGRSTVETGETDNEVISVFDVSDEPPSARAAAHAAAILDGLASPGHASQISTSLWSSVTSTQSSPRQLSQDDDDNDAVLLDTSLSSMLRRLTADQILDETLSRSVRRALQQGTSMPCHCLSDEQIRSLPKVRFESADQQQCSICLESYKEGELLTALRCNHFFHVECVARWMRRATICPLCRAPCSQES